jgi:hypothetical protein
MSKTEKARVNGPIPNAVVYHDSPESKASPLKLQASRLVRLYALDVATAEALAPLAFGVPS